MEIMPKRNDHRPEVNARVGVERTTSSKKHLDRLTRDVLAAQAAGMSYGKYKAAHPHTPEDDEEPEPAKPQTDPGIYERTCTVCGKVFYVRSRAQRNYCGDWCRRIAKSQREQNLREMKKQEALANGSPGI